MVLPVKEGDLVCLSVTLLPSRELLDVDVSFDVHRELDLATVVDDDQRPAAEVPAVEAPARDRLPSLTAREGHAAVSVFTVPAGARGHSALLWMRGPAWCGAGSLPGCIPGGGATMAGQAGSRTSGHELRRGPPPS